eukprot:2396816-Prymnesium_polylepis.2
MRAQSKSIGSGRPPRSLGWCRPLPLQSQCLASRCPARAVTISRQSESRCMEAVASGRRNVVRSANNPPDILPCQNIYTSSLVEADDDAN